MSKGLLIPRQGGRLSPPKTLEERKPKILEDEEEGKRLEANKKKSWLEKF